MHNTTFRCLEHHTPQLVSGAGHTWWIKGLGFVAVLLMFVECSRSSVKPVGPKIQSHGDPQLQIMGRTILDPYIASQATLCCQTIIQSSSTIGMANMCGFKVKTQQKNALNDSIYKKIRPVTQRHRLSNPPNPMVNVTTLVTLSWRAGAPTTTVGPSRVSAGWDLWLQSDDNKGIPFPKKLLAVNKKISRGRRQCHNFGSMLVWIIRIAIEAAS